MSELCIGEIIEAGIINIENYKKTHNPAMLELALIQLREAAEEYWKEDE